MKIETCIFVQKHSDTNVINLGKTKQLSNEKTDYKKYIKQSIMYPMQKRKKARNLRNLRLNTTI